MDLGYNLDNLEALFKKYLLAGNVKPLSGKNYLSDFRHFAGWLTLYWKSHLANASQQLSRLTPEIINEYKNYLIENSLPHKTINRRLSTVRKFCSFCISQGWLKENPAKQVGNIGPTGQISPIGLIRSFAKDLAEQNLDQPTIKSYLDDVREFLEHTKVRE